MNRQRKIQNKMNTIRVGNLFRIQSATTDTCLPGGITPAHFTLRGGELKREMKGGRWREVGGIWETRTFDEKIGAIRWKTRGWREYPPPVRPSTLLYLFLVNTSFYYRTFIHIDN